MNSTDSSAPAWKLLGELELIFSVEADAEIRAWLTRTLAPLELPAELAARVLKSAQEAAGRAMQSGSAVSEPGHIHLLILITPDSNTKGKPWGFFRIEKMEGASKAHDLHDHAIEFYLYRESR